MIRATGIAEHMARKAKVSDWIRRQRESKWSWAGHVARRQDGRWSHTILDWTPQSSRKPGHPRLRWSDRL
eukprot:3037431-Karenia_brevis.AAC.1